MRDSFSVYGGLNFATQGSNNHHRGCARSTTAREVQAGEASTSFFNLAWTTKSSGFGPHLDAGLHSQVVVQFAPNWYTGTCWGFLPPNPAARLEASVMLTFTATKFARVRAHVTRIRPTLPNIKDSISAAYLLLEESRWSAR